MSFRADVAGRGYGSPIVVGNNVILQVADQQQDVQAVACYDRGDGRLLWQTTVHRGGLTTKNEKSTAASSTPACVGDRLFVNFLNGDAVYTTALDLSGQQLWQTKICDYVIHQGYGSSPAVYRDLVLVAADNKAGGSLQALRQDTGEVQWQRDRPQKPNYPSPVVLRVAGRDQLLMTGCDLVTGLDPLTGDILWETAGSTTECVTSTVTDGTRIFTSGGYPRNHMSAVRADGSGTIEWENKNRVYVPSMLVVGDHLYAVTDAGIATCWHSETGKEVWRSRVGGSFSSSPVLVNDQIYATNDSGETFIFNASRKASTCWRRISWVRRSSRLRPFVTAGIYTRVAEWIDGQRQERLYCVGNGPQ